MTFQSRIVHPMCCVKCMGTGRRVDYSRELGEGCTVECDHSTATATLAGMPLEPDEERWLAAERECDRLREALRKYGGHTASCPSNIPCGQGRKLRCSCGFGAEWRRVFGYNP